MGFAGLKMRLRLKSFNICGLVPGLPADWCRFATYLLCSLPGKRGPPLRCGLAGIFCDFLL
jgi:hypothetical protein